ncbi:hypothetical protein Acr_20g0009380 [Actinidia rufa]|uniref:Reverse transcriptase zinc-binding domain-containing protein n=1 Tax=Actinidia rufa TaxID=165716 RepID=A0A7J0GE77_9ERIC|nr:hypothetical protein Acr_20g0009380 [Actinidia rufa]
MCRLPLPGLAEPLPLGMTSGGARLSRPKQIDFFQRFMSMPFVPSYSPLRFFSLHRRLTFPFPDYWHYSRGDHFKFDGGNSSQAQNNCCIMPLLNALLGMWLVFPLFAFTVAATWNAIRVHSPTVTWHKLLWFPKCILSHSFMFWMFLHHNLTVEAAWPELFVDHVGAVLTACLGDNLVRSPVEDNSLPFEGLGLRASGINSTILADIFASMSVSMQHGNFQRCYSAGSTQDLYNSHQPRVEAIQAICPIATLSRSAAVMISYIYLIQIAGTFSFRVDSGVSLDLKDSGWHLSVDDPVFAIEYALQVLGSAKAVACAVTGQETSNIKGKKISFDQQSCPGLLF